MTSAALRRSVVGAATTGLVLGPVAVLACPVCFGVEDGPAADGARAAVAVLMGVTGLVLSGAAAFVVRFVRRTRRMTGSAPGR
jgi:hypothetical protein